MVILSARHTKYDSDRKIDLARAEPVAVAKHGRPVVVALTVEEFERLQAVKANGAPKALGGTQGKE